MRTLKRFALPVLLLIGLLVGQVGAVMAQDQAEDKPTITVGSKNYTEQLILGEMISLMLEDAGFDVERQLYLGGTAVVHQGLVSGEIDTYVEYTGTGLIALLGREVPEGSGSATPVSGTPAPSVAEQTYDIVAEAYPEEFGAVWLEPIGFNNTFALAVTREVAEEYNLQTISDLKGIASELTLGSDPEFAVRPDGLPGVEAAYGIEFGNVQTLDVGLLYEAVDSGEVDISVVATTDGRIPALDLVVLEDDLGFFPPYYAAPVVNQELIEENPEVADVLNQLAGKIDNETMQAMNYQVDGEGAEPIDVARDFLVEEGIIDGEED